jgi:ABC-type transporter Mla subunit MlaD
LSDKVRIDGQHSAQHYARTQGNDDPMNQHHLGKHDRAPQTAHFTNAGAVAAGGTGVEVDVDHLQSALTKLQGRHDEFAGTVANAAALTDQLPNGTGPTAEMMGQFYQHRVGDTGGVQYALNAHLSHLDTIVTNLNATITNYTNSANEALRAVQDAPADGAPTS